MKNTSFISLLLSSLLLAVFLLLSSCDHHLSPDAGPAPADSLAIYREVFGDPQMCANCHPQHYQEWRASMHAYAFTDPIFFQLDEIGQMRSSQQLDQFCIKCHSPVATVLQEAPPGFDPAALTEISKQGISCDVCHAMKSFERGKGISGFHLDKVRRGPIDTPVTNNFHESQFDRRFDRSPICSGCHDVINPEETQVEFTTTEWDNSPYVAMGLECQGCHMPVYTGQAAVNGPERIVHRHTFTGVDIPLVDFPGRETTLAQVEELLQNAVTMTVQAPSQLSRGDTLRIEVTINNDKTGHDIPSGTTFERQMWLEVIVRNSTTGVVLYQSGDLDDNGDLRNHHSQSVTSGALPADTDLALFHGVPYRNGAETLFFWEAERVENKTIKAFTEEKVAYAVAPGYAASVLDLSVRLRFRSFAPYFLRAIDMADLADVIPIVDMETFEQQIVLGD